MPSSEPPLPFDSADVLSLDINSPKRLPAKPAWLRDLPNPCDLPPAPRLHEPRPCDPLNPNTDVTFRHSGWHADRARVYAALRSAFPNSRRQDRFRGCGSEAWVIRSESEPGLYAIASDHCHDRFCRPCARFKGSVLAHNVAAYLAGRPYRFITFTLKNTDLTLKEAIDKLYRSFALIRRTRVWSTRVTGGVAFCEVKPGTRAGTWHPHLHVLAEGRYIPLKPLRKAWLKITTDSFIVDIAFGRDVNQAARYVTKYVTKPMTNEVLRQPELLREVVIALHGRRLATTFGTWRGLRLCDYKPRGVWIRVCPLAHLRQRAADGDDDALALLDYLVTHHPGHRLPSPRAAPFHGDSAESQ